MNSPDPVTPPPAPTPGQPVFSPEPWYHSEMQVRLVLALVAQLISIALRTVEVFGVKAPITEGEMEILLANITQGAALVFAVLAMIKRQQSHIQPLTMTAKSAEQSKTANPPLFDMTPKQLK